MAVQGETWLLNVDNCNISQSVPHNHQHAKRSEMSFGVLVTYVQPMSTNGRGRTYRAKTDKWYEIWYGYR